MGTGSLGRDILPVENALSAAPLDKVPVCSFLEL